MVIGLETLLVVCAVTHMSYDPECSRFFLMIGAFFAVLLGLACFLCIYYCWKPRNYIFVIGAIIAVIGTIAYTIYVNEYCKEEWAELHLGKKERRSSEDFVNDIIVAAVVFITL